MHDPKFENEVQKKLEELSFSPSEAVWTRVERAVNEKRRRRLPLFWFFLLPSLGLAGAGMIYFSKHQTTPAVQVVQHAPAPVSAPASSMPDNKAAASTQTPSVARTAPGEKTRKEIPTSNTHVPANKPTLTDDPARPQDKTPAIAGTYMTSSSDPVARQNMTSSSDPLTRPDVARQDMASPRTPAHAGLPGLRSFDHQFAAPAASRLASSSTTAAARTPINLKPKYIWEVGFAGGIGASSLNSSLFRQPTVAASDVQAMAAPMPVNAAYKAPVSGVQPDISYWAGIIAQRPFSKSLTLSLGLNLHYYSNRQQIGDAVYNDPSSLYRASTLFSSQQSPGTAPNSGVYPYYSVGSMDVFVNRYYFLEMPASVLWKVNHSRNLPLFWENGLSLSYLVSSNSIYYNAKSGVFYKDQGNMANKTQLNLSTALLVGLPIKNMRLQAGPQIQYGLTSLQRQSTIGQHLFYGGIRIVLIPGKAKK